MNIKRIILWIVSSLYLGLSLISVFMFSSKVGVWRELIDLDKLTQGGTHHFILIVVFLVIFILTYIFANSTKHVFKHMLNNQGLTEEETQLMLDRISLLASFFAIILTLLTILERTFLLGFNNEFIKLALVSTMLIMNLAINNFLDRKFSYVDSGDSSVHYLISIPVLVLNVYILIGIFNIIIFR